MTRALGLALVLGLPLAGCSLSGAELAPSSFAQNQCKGDEDCPDARCEDGACLGSDGALQALLVTVTPPSTVSGVTSLAYYRRYTSANLPANGDRLDIALGAGVDLNGTVSVDTTCLNGVIPADVTFTPTEHALGVPSDSYHSKLGTRDGDVSFTQTLPPGQYDVYITPHQPGDAMLTDPSCQVPPRLILNQPVTSSLDFKLPASSKMIVDVAWPLSEPYSDAAAQADPSFVNPLAGWTLDLVDPNTGLVLSAEEPLTALKMPPINPDMSVTYEVTLVYSPVYEFVKDDMIVPQPTPIGGDILRLTPPAQDPRDPSGQTPYTAPIVLAQLDGALVDADGTSQPAQIVQTDIVPAAVHVQFQTGLASDGSPVAASVLLLATSIDGISGLPTSFSRNVSVDKDGVGDVDLLPGHYHVSAVAPNACAHVPCLGTVETDWVIGQAVDPQTGIQAGKLIEFEPRASYSGYAYVYRGLPAAGATVSLVASPLLLDANVLNVGDGSVAPVPQSSGSAVDSSGYFSFEADSGTFDLRVQPDPSTGFGWFVRPGFVLPDAQDALAELDVDLPIFYKGSITASSSSGQVPVSGALIRAYAYVQTDGSPATTTDGNTVVEVAETYSEDQSGTPGDFTLLVPPAFAPH